MAFPRNHLYLTVHWVPTGAILETGQFGLRFDSQAASTQALVDSCKAAVQAFWQTVGAGIPPDMSLRFLRLARIGTDGKYVPGSVAFDGNYATNGVGGNATSTVLYPLQIATVSTLTTDVPRGQGSKGRVYLPASPSALGADYRFTAGSADARSASLATMISSLKTTLGGPCIVASRGTVSSSTGLYQAVTGVKTGRRPDVQRRRARAVTELYGVTSPIT